MACSIFPTAPRFSNQIRSDQQVGKHRGMRKDGFGDMRWMRVDKSELYLAWRWLFGAQVPPAGWDRAPWEAGGAEDYLRSFL
jgi:hypothetical protein